MKNTTTLIQASIISLFATHFATANPVQWKIEDGGNGHWYERTYEPGEITWYQARSIAQARGGDSVVFNTLVERMFINDHFVDGQPYCAPASWAQRYTFWLGLYQDLKAPDYSEPSGGWYWVDGTPLDWDVVCEEPYYCAFSNGGTNPEHFGVMGDGGVGWIQDEAVNADIYCVESALIEWSADCNGDGIVDYGQILDGTYADEDGNGVPDCCDEGVPCDGGLSMVGPIQWQVADGGNGHWYQLAYSNEPLDEDDVFVLDRIGAHEATLVSQPELDWAWDNLASLPQAWREDGGSLVGARIGLGNYCLSNFHWVTAEPVTFTSWGPGEPSSNCGQASFFVADASEGPQKFWSMVSSLDFPRYAILLEWDNDCDGNGLIDFGEILDGSATDADGNGIPDHCEAAKKWPSSEGGNGHWYQYITQDLWTYEEGQAHAAAMGAHLASIADAAEDGFVDQRIADVSQAFDHDPFIGADRLAGPWQWLTGEAWAYSDWGNGQPVSWCCDALTIVGRPPAPMLRWSNQETFYPRPIIIEWDADCNGDGIVDIGQILDGIYDDLDGNGVPDCCEGGSPCNQCELADISDDGEVSIEDILILIAFWGPCDACIADLDMSGEVDISDLLIVIDNWGTCE